MQCEYFFTKWTHETNSDQPMTYLNVKSVPMSSMDSSSAFDVGKVNLYLWVSNAGTIKAYKY